jgi:hypothetical protein
LPVPSRRRPTGLGWQTWPGPSLLPEQDTTRHEREFELRPSWVNWRLCAAVSIVVPDGQSGPTGLARLATWLQRATNMPTCFSSASGYMAPSATRRSSTPHLARWIGQACDRPRPWDQYAALLPIRERVLGADHLKTLPARADLADRTENADRVCQ